MLFWVKARTIVQERKVVSRNPFMKLDKLYPVLDIYKYKDKESGFVTSFLIADNESGELIWVPALSVSYVEKEK